MLERHFVYINEYSDHQENLNNPFLGAFHWSSPSQRNHYQNWFTPGLPSVEYFPILTAEYSFLIMETASQADPSKSIAGKVLRIR